MNGFEIPQGAMPDPVPTAPPPDPAMAREQAIADTTRAEEALNGFIAAKQHALFEAPDAFYRTQGSDAIHAAPAILDTLSKLRDDHLDGLANDAQRARLAPALDAHLDLARDDIARHVAEQSLAWQRRVAQDRIALLTKEAAYHHNDDDRIDAIGEAADSAARAHARVGDGLDQQAEDVAAELARSGVLSSAIQARLNSGDLQGANALFTEAQDRLDPVHAAPLQGRLDAVFARPLPYRPSIDGADIKAVPLPYRPPTDGSLDVESMLQYLANVPGGESASDQGSGDIVPVNTPLDAPSGAEHADPRLAQAQTTTIPAKAPGNKVTQPPRGGPLVTPARAPVAAAQGPERYMSSPNISENEMDASALLLRDMRRRERELTWKEMIGATLPDTSPGTGRQAPLSEDWRADLNEIDKQQHVGLVKLVEEAAKTYKLPPELLARLLHRESNFDTTKGTVVVNGKRVPTDKATGIPQMFRSAAEDAGVTRSQLAAGTAGFQINAGAKYLAQQFDRFKDWPTAVAAYHSGYPTVGDWKNGSGPNFESEDQRRADYVIWHRPNEKDKNGNPLQGRWALVHENESDRQKRDVNNWKELKDYLPYIFLGDPKRYDVAPSNVPKRQ
jgi:soluble lytic murein transglycosylase-like protein